MSSVKKWRESDTIKFVQLYEKAECLWNFRHPGYKHRNARDKEIQHIIEEMNLPDFGVNELKNKIKNIRSTYQQEVNKIRRSKQGFRGDILEEYKTNLAWFPIADRFLGTVINSTKNPLPKLEEDMENYVKFKLMGGIKKLKPNVVPHIFDCQLDVRLPTLSAESTTTSSKDDSSSIQMDQNNTIYSVQVLSDVNESPKQSTIAVMETCVKTEEEDASFYHSNQPALYNLVETEMNGEIDNEIDVKYQPFTISLDQIKEEIDIDDYNSPSVTHQLKKRKSSHQSAYEAIDQSSRTESDTHIHNPVEDIQKDEWYHFGNNIACQLRNLSLERALMCQQKIIEILTQERIDFITKMKTEDTNTTKED